MIQILALRPYTDKSGKTRKTHRVVGKNWEAPSVAHLFANWEYYLKSIPKKEQWNVYYTALDCKPGDPKNGKSFRKFVSQKVIPFDIDGIDTTKPEIYIDLICKKLDIDIDKTGIVFTGNGLQLIIELHEPFTDINYFDDSRPYYKSCCDAINRIMADNNLPGSADSSVWSAARILRFGGTTNDKTDKGKGITQARFLKTNIEPQEFDLESASGIPQVEESEQLHDVDYPAADNTAILSQCQFIKYCQENPNAISEPEWYALLSITSRMDNGNELSHQFSQGHSNYSHAETENKIEQAMASSGPRTCKSINATSNRCKGCKHFKTKLLSPILIKSEDFIATEKIGFHIQIKNKDGKVIKMIPQYKDLMRFLNREGPHRVIDQSGLTYRFNGTHYIEFSETQIKAFAEEHFNPEPKESTANEFKCKIKRNNLIPTDFFTNTDGNINFLNGVLSIDTGTLTPHDPDLGFRYCLPYNYDPLATAPRFVQFLNEVTGGDKSLAAILEEFGGYALTGGPSRYQKALVMTGTGKNGKSKFIETLCAVAGSENYSTVNIRDLKNENNRQLLQGKLFNISGETPNKALNDSSEFKIIVRGEEMMVKLMYNQPYKIECRAKPILSCNELPATTDVTYGFFRSFLIVPFNQSFEGKNDDKFLLDKLKAELPGIFNVFLEGYKRLVKQGEFSKSAASEKSLEVYQEESDPIVRFVNEFIEEVPAPLEGSSGSLDEVSVDHLYQSYRSMCDSREFTAVNDMVFFKKLRQVIPEYDEKRNRMRVDGRQVRTLKNIRCCYE